MATMDPFHTVPQGRRYRLRFRNASDGIRSRHLRRHSFELVRVGSTAILGIPKDVVMLGGVQEAEFEFVTDNPSLTYRQQQLHMDFGCMALFKYA
jgi:FtsP/CotA-like multicopper oxidase with cupredoxin domain